MKNTSENTLLVSFLQIALSSQTGSNSQCEQTIPILLQTSLLPIILCDSGLSFLSPSLSTACRICSVEEKLFSNPARFRILSVTKKKRWADGAVGTLQPKIKLGGWKIKTVRVSEKSVIFEKPFKIRFAPVVDSERLCGHRRAPASNTFCQIPQRNQLSTFLLRLSFSFKPLMPASYLMPQWETLLFFS